MNEREREQRLSHLKGEDRELGARILDAIELVYERNLPAHTDFLDPREREIAVGLAGGLNGIAYRFSGGYKGAERARMTLFPDFFLTETLEDPVGVVAVTGSFEYADVSHRDFLGAILGLGLKRQKIGDLVLVTSGCQAVVAREVVPVIVLQLHRVRNVPVTVTEIDPEQLQVTPERIKEIAATVSSLRLDAVASAGFSTSRTQMAKEIKAGRVKLNWKETLNSSASVSPGDVISIRGRGRVEVSEVGGTTRKGRYKLRLKRYI